jgi:hypothetical protein
VVDVVKECDQFSLGCDVIRDQNIRQGSSLALWPREGQVPSPGCMLGDDLLTEDINVENVIHLLLSIILKIEGVFFRLDGVWTKYQPGNPSPWKEENHSSQNKCR